MLVVASCVLLKQIRSSSEAVIVFIKVFVFVPVEKGVIGGWKNSLTSGPLQSYVEAHIKLCKCITSTDIADTK
jgi:hypothetical protein